MKNIFKIFCFLAITSLTITGYTQSEDSRILMTVGNEQVTVSEFLSVYMKNNIQNNAMDRKSLEEYVNLYINFKLKVKEAIELGLDTAASFKNELHGYRKQLSQPYLSDKEVDDALITETWERMQFDIRASHILIMVNKNATPKDTLEAYNLIMKLRNRIMKGEDFEKVAREASADSSARDRMNKMTLKIIKGNGGDLGYFTALDMVYPFETGAYKTSPGKVSMPVRTDFGYHLIKVTDRKPAMGKVTVAHVYINVPADIKPEDKIQYKNKIDEAYKMLQEGEEWESIVKKYSDDKGSAAKGGQLPSFGVNRMVPEFIAAIADIKNIGDYSPPVQTAYGWHIIKLIDRKVPGNFEDEKAILKNRIAHDSRASKSKEAFINHIKQEYNFSESVKALTEFYNVVDLTIFEGNWDVEKAKSLNNEILSIDNIKYYQKDFASYLAAHQAKQSPINIPEYINSRYADFTNEICMSVEDSKLEEKYPDFKILMKEYRDGILLFELTDQKVWTKAIKDTAGLETFYESNKTNYMWEERLDASIYTCDDEVTAKAARKLAGKQEKKKYSDNYILKQINIDSIPKLEIESGLFLRKQNELTDNVTWEKGISDNITKDNKIVFVVIKAVIPPTPKTIKEAKGLITADYQNYLENEWIKELKNKYPVEVNKQVLESLIKE